MMTKTTKPIPWYRSALASQFAYFENQDQLERINMSQQNDPLHDLKTFMATRHRKLREAQKNLDMAAKDYTDLLYEQAQLNRKISAAENKVNLAEEHVANTENFWFGPQGISWVIKKSKFVPLKLLNDIEEQGLQLDEPLVRALTAYLEDPNGQDYPDFKVNLKT
jgi:hypothetical protein